MLKAHQEWLEGLAQIAARIQAQSVQPLTGVCCLTAIKLMKAFQALLKITDYRYSTQLPLLELSLNAKARHKNPVAGR
jgi:hypothetical protein